MIITRYLHRQISATTVGVTVILLLVLLTNQVARYLYAIAAGNLPFDLLLKMVGIQVPVLLIFLLPLGLYLGILLGYGRLYADQEMCVLESSGVGYGRLLRITAVPVIAMTVLVGILMWQAKPALYHRQQTLLTQGMRSPLDTIVPGQFQRFAGGKWVAYAGGRHPDGTLNDVFVVRIPSGGEGPKAFDVVTSKTLQETQHPNKEGRFLVFRHGHRYRGQPGEKDFRLLKYGTLEVHLLSNVHAKSMAVEKSMPSMRLWQQRHENHLAAVELQWRLAIPLSVLILSLFALPLSHLKPRQGRYRKFLPALLIYIIYMQLLFVARTWAKQDLLGLDPVYIFSAVHAGMALLALLVAAFRS